MTDDEVTKVLDKFAQKHGHKSFEQMGWDENDVELTTDVASLAFAQGKLALVDEEIERLGKELEECEYEFCSQCGERKIIIKEFHRLKSQLSQNTQLLKCANECKISSSQDEREEGMKFIKEFGEECKELGMKVKKTKDGIEITPTNESMERLFLLMGAIPQKKLKASRGEQGEKR
jgi:hypothetical protein